MADEAREVVEPGVRDRRAVGDDQDPPDVQGPHQVVRRQRLAEPWLGVPEHLGLPGLEGGHGLVDGRLLLGTQDVVVFPAAAREVGEVLAGEVVEVLQRRLRRDLDVMPLGPLRRGLALHAVLVQVGVEVLVREVPTSLRREQGPPRPQLLLVDGQLGRLLRDARVCALLLGVPDLLPPRVLGDVRGRPGVDERSDLTECPDLRTRHRPSLPHGPCRSCKPGSCRRR